MDRHVNYTIVGTFVLLGFLGIFAFLAWYADKFDEGGIDRYTIHFSGSVNGLTKGGLVSYRGVEVGRITDIRFEKSRPDTVMVDVEVDEETPVTKATDAKLKPRGITGVAFIELVTENLNAGPIERKPGQKYPVIEASSSTLERLFDDVPEISNNLIRITDKIDKILSTQNIEDLDKTINNVAAISEQVSQASERFDDITLKIDDAADDLGNISRSAQETIERTSALIEKLDTVLSRNEGNVDRFLDEDLRQFSKLVAETREAAEAVSSLARELKQDPSAIIYKREKSGVELPR